VTAWPRPSFGSVKWPVVRDDDGDVSSSDRRSRKAYLV
jgi:hypothetical protein